MRTLLCCTLLSLLTSAAMAGPLDPPAGPITPTNRTLKEVEPRTPINSTNTPAFSTSMFRITQPGSYYLPGNITLSGGYTTAIEIVSSNVTIDLGGFTITGPAGPASGIRCSGVAYSLVIRNGMITGCATAGVDIAAAFFSQISDVVVTSCGYGIAAGTDARVEGCSVSLCTGDGIYTGARSVVERCLSDKNGVGGIKVSNFSTVRACSTSDNGDVGISTSDGASVVECTSSGNTVAGIRVPWGCTVQRCDLYSNDGDGINFSSYCRILENSIRSGSAGLRGLGTRNLVSGNNIVQSLTGIKMDVGSNLVVGNTVSEAATAAFNIASGNRVGTIVNMATSAAINGSSGGSTGTSDKTANFVY